MKSDNGYAQIKETINKPEKLPVALYASTLPSETVLQDLRFVERQLEQGFYAP